MWYAHTDLLFAHLARRQQDVEGLGGLGWQVVEVGVRVRGAGQEARYRYLSTAWCPERARSVQNSNGGRFALSAHIMACVHSCHPHPR